MNLERVHQNDILDFRQMVEAYWQEIMPHSDIVQSHESREAYFKERFPLEDDDVRLLWGVVNGRKIGFVALALRCIACGSTVIRSAARHTLAPYHQTSPEQLLIKKNAKV